MRHSRIVAVAVAVVALMVVAVPAHAGTMRAETTTPQPAPVEQWAPSRAYSAGVVVGFGGRRWRAAYPTAGYAPGADAAVGVPQGFAAGTTGGAGGRQVWVTTLTDNGPGSLRAAAATPGRLWVRFAVDGTIRLTTPVKLHADTTIDGRGADITIAGRGLRVEAVRNVIITTVAFDHGSGDTTDAILVWRKAAKVWLDHLDIAGYPDEGIDISQGATDVTVSWTHIHHQDKAILIGSWGDNTTTDSPSRVTIHHTWFDHTGQRNPRAVRHSQVHAYNNYLHNWTGVGMASANYAQLLSQANLVAAGERDNALSSGASGRGRAPDEGYARIQADALTGGAQQDERRPDEVFTPPYTVTVRPPDDALRATITAHAGAPTLPDDPPWVPEEDPSR
jgi:pectate lyase